MKKLYKIVLSSFLLLLLFPLCAKAAFAGLSLGGSGSVNTDSELDINITVINSGAEKTMTMGGTVSVSNPGCVSFVGITPVAGGADAEGQMISFFKTSGVTGNFTVAKIKLKAGSSACSTTIQLREATISSVSGIEEDLPTISKTITVTKPAETTPSDSNPGNNNPGNNTPSNNTPSNNTPSNNTPSNNTPSNNGGSSTPANNGGTSNSGNNKPAIDDKRSTDNSLKKLVVTNGELSPAFNANTLNYTVNVPLEVTKLDLSAEVNDPKVKINISNPDLAENAKTNVTIKVTAENGSVKTYTITVLRGTLPEKPLNSDNTLSSLSPSIGILSPKFDATKTNYYVYLPYEVETIDFSYTLSDGTATAELIGDKNLNANKKNNFKIVVKAEDGSEKTYNITVFRAINPEFMNNSSVKIKDLKIGKAKLKGKFNKDITHYYYTGKLNLSDIKLVDEYATYNVISSKDVTYIVVEAPNGDMGVYCFHKKKINILIIVLSATTCLGLIGSGYLFVDKYYLTKIKVKKEV